MEDNGGEERIDRRVDIIINEQTTGSPLNLFETPTMQDGEHPKKLGSSTSLFRHSSFCHLNTFSDRILSIIPEQANNIIRTAASLSDLSQIANSLMYIWVVCETLFSSPLKNRDLHIRPSIPAADLAIFSFLLSLVSRIFKGMIRRAVRSFVLSGN